MASVLQIRFAQTDPAAKQDITNITQTQNKPWSSVEELRYDDVEPPENYLTCEKNYGLLNGKMKAFPNDPASKRWGYWSESVSGIDGSFGINIPTIDITFSVNHKSIGVTLYFHTHTGDHAREVRLTWYDSSNVVIHQGVYQIKSHFGNVEQKVDGYRRIKIEFLSTNLPNRYIKMYALDIGLVRTFMDKEVSQCDIFEDIDPTVESISINTLNSKIITRNSIFSPLMSADYDDMMMKKQSLTVYKNDKVYGFFFLDKWNDPFQSGIVFDIEAADAMSVLDLYDFNGGLYTNKPVTELLNEIFNICFPTRLVTYQLDDSLSTKTVTGWIPRCKCGEAFQHIMFAIRAIADTSRRRHIWIYQPDTEITYEIPLTQRYRKIKDETTDYYSGVDVTSYNYTQSTEEKQLFKQELGVGSYRVNFNEPIHSCTATGATITTTHPNYVIVNVTSATEVIVSGKVYKSNPLTHSARTEVATGQIESIKSYDGYYLVGRSIGNQIAQQNLQWLQNRIKSEMDIVLNDREVGYVAQVETRGRDLVGTITAIDSNLRANKSTVTVIGNAVGGGL